MQTIKEVEMIKNAIRKKEVDLGNDNIPRLMLRLIIPSMLAQFVNVLYSIVDRIFISGIPQIGELALAGIGVCAPIIVIITSFCYLVALGGAPLVAIKLGEKNKTEAQKIMSNSFVGLVVISCIMTIVFWLAKKPLLMTFGASETTYQYANDYLVVYLAGTIFAMLSLGLNAFVNCQGYSLVAMISVLIGAVVNICLDALFIVGLNMGVQGAGLATVIAQCCSCIWVVVFLLGKKTKVRLSFKGLDIKVMARIVKLGLSPFLIMATEGVIIVALNSVLQQKGGELADQYIACATIIVSCMQLIVVPLAGVTAGAQSVMSYNFGAKNFDRIKKAFKFLVWFCFGYLAICYITIMSVPQVFIGIFSQDSTIMSMAIKGIRMYCGGVIFMTSQYPCVDTLTAFGCAGKAVSLSMFRKLFVLIPLTFILPYCLGVEYTFLAQTIADVVGGCVCAIVFACSIKSIFQKRANAPL